MTAKFGSHFVVSDGGQGWKNVMSKTSSFASQKPFSLFIQVFNDLWNEQPYFESTSTIFSCQTLF